MTGAVPFRVLHDSGHPEIEWVRTHGRRFTEPFFDDTIARLAHEFPENRGARRARTPLDRLRETPPGVPPTALIFHISRCGSTLVSRMLAAAARNIVISEPPVIDDLLRLSRRDRPTTESERIEWLRGAMRSFGAAQTGAGRLFVKLDCWHVFHLPLIARAFPGVPLLFVYREPLEVLVSLLRRPALTLVRDVIAPEHLGLTAAERDSLGPEEHAAAILGAFFRTAALHRASLTPIAYEHLPGIIGQGLPGCDFTDDERRQLLAVAALDAKDPTRRFEPDGAAKRTEASARLRAACARWTEPHHHEWLRRVSSPASTSRPKRNVWAG